MGRRVGSRSHPAAASRVARVGGVKPDRPAGRVARQAASAPAPARASRSSEAAQAAAIGRARDRAARRATPSRSPVRTNPPSPSSATDEDEVVGSRTRRVDDAERHVAGGQRLAVGQLADRVRQRPAAARAGQDRDPEPLRRRLGAGRVVRIDVGQGDGLDRAAALGGDPSARSSAGPGRVARVDQHEPAAADEVGADRLAGHAAAGRHHDPVTPGRRLVHLDRAERPGRQPRPDLVDRAHVLELLERRARRQPQRQPAVGHRRRARRPAAATRARRPRRPRTTASRRRAAPRRRTAHRTGAGSRAASPSARAGSSRSVRRRRSSASATLARRRLAAEQRGPRGVDARGRGGRLGEQHARLLEQLADRRDVARPARPRARGRRPSAAAASAGVTTDRAASDGSRIARVHPAAREDVRVGGERHRRRAMRQQRLEPVGPRRSRTTVAAGRASTARIVNPPADGSAIGRGCGKLTGQRGRRR